MGLEGAPVKLSSVPFLLLVGDLLAPQAEGRMSSTAPSKKPYRKAPPQHREVRHDVPILREDQDGVILAEQSQVTDYRAAKGLAPLHQQTGFSYAEAGQLKQAEGTEAGNLNFSSSCSLESSSDKELAGRRAGLSLKSWTLSSRLLPFGKARRRSGKPCKPHSCGRLSKFMSRSVETVVSGDEGQAPTCSFKSGSLERSLMFKEPAEVLAPGMLRVSSTHLPLKGILKQPGLLGVCPETLRKSRSVEALTRGHDSRKYSDTLLCLRKRERRSQERSSSSGSSAVDSTKRKEKLTEEKVQFSKFLDEISQRVLSPSHLRSVGESRGGGQESPSSPRVSTPEGQKETQSEGAKAKRAAERKLCQRQRNAEKRCEAQEMASSQRQPTEEAEQSPQPRKKLIFVRKDSKEKLISVERKVADLCQDELQQLAERGLAGMSSGQQQLLSSWKNNQEGERDREESWNEQPVRSQHLGAKPGQKHMMAPGCLERRSFSPPIYWSQEEGCPSPRTSPSFSLALNKVCARVLEPRPWTGIGTDPSFPSWLSPLSCHPPERLRPYSDCVWTGVVGEAKRLMYISELWGWRGQAKFLSLPFSTPFSNLEAVGSSFRVNCWVHKRKSTEFLSPEGAEEG